MGLLSDVLDAVGRFLFPRQFREEFAEEITFEEFERVPAFFERVEREREEEYTRKIVKTIYYCRGFSAHRGVKHSVFALTFEDNDTDRMPELIDEIESSPRYKDCYRTSDFGYDDSQGTDRPPHTYPTIEVGEE